MHQSHLMMTFDQIYALLLRFSEKIKILQDLSLNITEKTGQNVPTAWNNFIRQFNQGSYYHHRCQGYVECLRVTGAYSVPAINVWVNQLVYPAAEHFMQSMKLSKALQSDPNLSNLEDFHQLMHNFTEFQQIAMAILQYANSLNTLGPSFKI